MLRAKYVNKRYEYLYRSNIQTVEEVHIRFINSLRFTGIEILDIDFV